MQECLKLFVTSYHYTLEVTHGLDSETNAVNGLRSYLTGIIQSVGR
jgi:hypothetical protein